VELVLSFEHLGLGGTESYLLTTAEQLERLGHSVTVYAPQPGPMAEVAERRGVRVAVGADALPDRCDLAYPQDGATAYDLAGRYPEAPQAFRLASELSDLQLPPELPGVVEAVVVLAERFARRARALALHARLVRLRQPIDTERFAPLDSLRPRPRRAVLLGNWLRGARRELLVRTWTEAGIECRQVGLDGGWDPAPERAIADADIVVGKGRAALEGMACGKAVYLFDFIGGDGWVTPEHYEAMEADAFGGAALGRDVSAESLRVDLERYDPQMGVANRDLTTRNHSARHHAQHLVDVFRELAPREHPPDEAAELARLVRVQWATDDRVLGLNAENQRLLQRLRETENELDVLRSSRRYRLAAALGELADRVRRR
jgi:hypothetical protein